MKLLFCIKKLASSAGGAERVFCNLASELALRGHEVVVLTFDKNGKAPFYKLNSLVRSINIDIGDSDFPAKPWETILRMLSLRKICITERPDVAVGFMHSMFVPLSFSVFGLSIPVIGSEHIVPEHYKNRHLQKLLLYLSAFFIVRMTVLSELIRMRYPKIIRNKMEVMPNPIDFNPRNEVVVSESRKVILAVGRLEHQKNHAALIKAFAIFANHRPIWVLRIIGEGSLRLELEKLINSLGLMNRVEMPGIVSNISNEYTNSEIFVMPSHYESFGLATAEAMLSGLPVVGFADCPGTNELIETGVNGLLVSSEGQKVESLARNLMMLIDDEDLRRKLGGFASQKIAESMSVARVCDRWEHLLMSISPCGLD